MNTAENDIIFTVPFNLRRGGAAGTLSGELAFSRGGVAVRENGEDVLTLKLSDVREFSFEAGVGCVSIEAKTDAGSTVLARADMNYSRTFSAAAKRMSRFLDGKEPEADWGHFEGLTCPKCHRPYPPGTEVCPRCADKGSYLLRMWGIARPFRLWILASVLLYFIIAAVGLLAPYLNRVLVDDYIKAEQAPLPAQFIIMIALILGANLLSRLLGVGRALIQIITANKVIVRLRSMVFDKIQQLSLAGVTRRTSGELMNRVTSDTQQLRSFISDDFGHLIEELVTITAISVILFMYDWRLALMVLLPAPLVMISHRFMHRKLHRGFHKQWVLQAKANTILHDIFTGIRVVKAFGMEKEESQRFDAASVKEQKIRARNEKNFAIISPVTNFLMGVGEFFLLYYVGNKIIGGEMTLGQMQQFAAYSSMIYGPLRWLSSLPRRLATNMTSMVKIFDVLDEKPDVCDTENACEKELSGNIEMKNVSFGYDDTHNVLRNVSLSIKRGEMIGIVGRSGVGKTTLINLLMRLYDAEEGSISFDGTDIRDISQESLRAQIGAVLQETLLFTGSLYNNIAYGKPGAVKEEVLNAAKLAGVHSFAVRLPDGYNTVVGERGYTLSGGERQRVAIARALLHDPEILILDEATSSLDTETERDIQDALRRLIAGRTTIAIAHRLSTLRNATKLVVLDKGTVAETGTHEELMRRRGLYYELVMAQRQMSKMSPAAAEDGVRA